MIRVVKQVVIIMSSWNPKEVDAAADLGDPPPPHTEVGQELPPMLQVTTDGEGYLVLIAVVEPQQY